MKQVYFMLLILFGKLVFTGDVSYSQNRFCKDKTVCLKQLIEVSNLQKFNVLKTQYSTIFYDLVLDSLLSHSEFKGTIDENILSQVDAYNNRVFLIKEALQKSVSCRNQLGVKNQNVLKSIFEYSLMKSFEDEKSQLSDAELNYLSDYWENNKDNQAQMIELLSKKRSQEFIKLNKSKLDASIQYEIDSVLVETWTTHYTTLVENQYAFKPFNTEPYLTSLTKWKLLQEAKSLYKDKKALNGQASFIVKLKEVGVEESNIAKIIELQNDYRKQLKSLKNNSETTDAFGTSLPKKTKYQVVTTYKKNLAKYITLGQYKNVLQKEYIDEAKGLAEADFDQFKEMYEVTEEQQKTIKSLFLNQHFDLLTTKAYYSYDHKIKNQKVRLLKYRYNKKYVEALNSFGIEADKGQINNQTYEW
ncbi:hypothetical protein [Flammeovirga aprica]|uniref:Uncharacterized protein n=1 Tax=Flammeovirga aprica JL-4 TaxID=694437 RepID=A0A7X9RZQ1_9BACT|nr:hypothetical protein [Flammeovirga aprica]NME71678.1 hypothetical protein [Flammeovirga aprica JL-4]